MKKLHTVVMSLLAVTLVWGQGVQAQNEKAVPLELFACTYQEGMGMKDLDKVSARFSKWADKHEHGYSAWTITPQFRSSEEPFDVGWIGVWPDGASMGGGIQAFQDSAGDIGMAFAEVIDCGGFHALFSSRVVNAPTGKPNKTPLVQFASCTIAEGKTGDDVYKAHKSFSDYMVKNDSQAASWILWPVLGAGDIEFDYYVVSAYASYAQLGRAFETYANDGGFQLAMKTFGGVVDCDQPRLYDGKLVRDGTR